MVKWYAKNFARPLRGRKHINIFATLVIYRGAGAVNGHFRVAQIRLGGLTRGLTPEVAVNCPGPLYFTPQPGRLSVNLRVLGAGVGPGAEHEGRPGYGT